MYKVDIYNEHEKVVSQKRYNDYATLASEHHRIYHDLPTNWSVTVTRVSQYAKSPGHG